MLTDLQETKKRLRQQFLDEEGIHSLGIDKKNNAIRVYTSSPQLTLKKKIEAVAAPYKVIIVPDDEPSTVITNGASLKPTIQQ